MPRPVARLARSLAALSLALLPCLAAPLGAQPTTPPPLAAGADVNDWEAYYDEGVARLRLRKQGEAEPYFRWAERLEPSRAEPLFAQWVTFWAKDPRRYLRWLRDEKEVLQAPDVIVSDKLRWKALSRNPLVYQGLQVLILDQLPGRWPDDPFTRGWLAYGTLKFDRAAETWGNMIAREPKKHGWLRYYRALVFTAQERYDSSTVEMQRLVDAMRAEDAERIVDAYFPKAFPEYAIGRLLAARGDMAGATEALGRSLAEDLSFDPAHAWIGQLALMRGDTAIAVRELEQAVELEADDAYYRWQIGRALGAAGRDVDAVVHLRRATALEPHYADPYFSLALALDRLGKTEEAMTTYRAYLARATRAAPNAPRARARLAQLEGASK